MCVLLIIKIDICSGFSVFFINSCIMFYCGVDVFVPEHVRNEIDIAAFLIEHGSVGASKLMRGYFLVGNHHFGVFLYKILNGINTYTLILQGIKQGLE